MSIALPVCRCLGDPKFVGYETLWAEASGSKVAADRRNRLGAFRFMLHKLGREYDFEYMVVDTGPSNGMLNKVVVTSCDYMLAPVFPESFSDSSLSGMLNEVLPEWLDWQENFLRQQVSNPVAAVSIYSGRRPSRLTFSRTASPAYARRTFHLDVAMCVTMLYAVCARARLHR